MAMKGRYSRTAASMIFSLTTMPLVTFFTRRRIASAQRKPSGREIRRFAESSRVRSSHCTEAVMGAFIASVMRYRAREQIRSLRMGLRLYAIADEPIWEDSNGSSICRSCWSRRISFAMR